MAFIKEESEDMRIEEAFRVKHEDTETQTGWFSFSQLNSVILYSLTSAEMNDIFEECLIRGFI